MIDPYSYVVNIHQIKWSDYPRSVANAIRDYSDFLWDKFKRDS